MPKTKKISLPDQPTDQQVEAIALATIREVFEPDASNLADLTIPGDGSWSAKYRANDTNFSVSWDGTQFTKQVLGVRS